MGNLLQSCVHRIGVEAYYNSFQKYHMHQISGRCELARICSGDDPKYHAQHNHTMTVKVAKSLKRSKQLAEQGKLIFSLQTFSVVEVKTEIVSKKSLDKEAPRLLIPNLTHCLQSLRLVNAVHGKLMEHKNVTFTYDNPDHIRLLERLWVNLKPDNRRSKDRKSKEWGALGFQGVDPATDFRGMGLLGLKQMVYFSELYPEQAIYLLDLSNHPESAYFPFAATAINMTAFLLQLLQETRLHAYIFEREDAVLLHNTSDSPHGPSDDETCVSKAVDLIHDLYCEIYIEFGKLWKQSKPRDLMDFPRIFSQLKDQICEKYPAL